MKLVSFEVEGLEKKYSHDEICKISEDYQVDIVTDEDTGISKITGESENLHDIFKKFSNFRT